MENMWKGKHICFLGDSITEGVGVTPETAYWHLLEEKSGIVSHCYGVNGARFGEMLSQAERMKNELGSSFDAVFVMAGTNDYNSSLPLGEWFSFGADKIITEKNEDGTVRSQQVRKTRSFLFDENTFKGNINRVLSFLKENYPDKQVVLLTPIHRAYAEFGTCNIQYNEMFSNAQGLFLDSYVEVLKEAAGIWATELIDMHSVSGLFPLYDKSAELYFNNVEWDRLHPGKGGHERMANVIAAKLNVIPVL